MLSSAHTYLTKISVIQKCGLVINVLMPKCINAVIPEECCGRNLNYLKFRKL